MAPTIATLAKRLLQQSLAQARLIDLIEAEQLVEEEIANTGISDFQRKILHDAAIAAEIYAIDAEWMLTKLGFCNGSDSAQIVRTLVRDGFIPKERSGRGLISIFIHVYGPISSCTVMMSDPAIVQNMGVSCVNSHPANWRGGYLLPQCEYWI